MSKFYIEKIIYHLQYLEYLLGDRVSKNLSDNNSAKKFVDFNNKKVLKKIQKKIVSKISILLPHCIQNYECNLKITNNINNCKNCGLCDISEILNLKQEFGNIDIKVATGGTLARLYLKEYQPELVIAVACKRDLIAGIRDCYPIPVYGVFNEIVDTPCKNTKISANKLKEVLREVGRK
ncbi:DUF116 domain-containing protein [uncultured Cetobacterium sp.]|uniref:DUF116 domain-containing protein n=1 Tax=uncultured Cetobacterium sp. TaxID=527638 RepID=UPI002628B42A|nr:DUF116 domain-containing protein [uncultured Cetobacterium sp.]